MGTLFDLLPFLEGWEYEVIEHENVPLAPGRELSIYLAEKMLGWVLSAEAYIYGENGEKAEVTVATDDSVVDVQPQGLYLTGVVQRGIMTPYLHRYDTVNHIYSVGVDFPYPIPFKSRVRLTITGPSENQVTVSGYISIIRIKPGKKEEFLASLREVLGAPGTAAEIAAELAGAMRAAGGGGR